MPSVRGWNELGERFDESGSSGGSRMQFVVRVALPLGWFGSERVTAELGADRARLIRLSRRHRCSSSGRAATARQAADRADQRHCSRRP